jgi:tetratricopeptide (TPR) repeat protein
MNHVKNLFKKKILPIILVMGIIHLVYLAWRSFSDEANLWAGMKYSFYFFLIIAVILLFLLLKNLMGKKNKTTETTIETTGSPEITFAEPKAPVNLKNALQQTKQLREEGRYRDVIQLLWPFYEQDFSDPAIAIFLTEAYNNLEENRTARNLAQKTLEYNPENIALLEQLAAAQYVLDETEDALQTAQKILQLQPHNIIAKRIAGNTLAETGEYDKAMTIFLELERLDELSGNNKFHLADCYMEKEDYETAIDYLKAVMVDSGECHVCWNNIAYCYKKLYLLMDCIDAADKSLEINEEYANPMFHKAEALYEMGIINEAFEWAEKASRLGYAPAYQALASWMVDLKK